MIPKQTECECDHAGWCERHQRYKFEHDVRRCQRSLDAFERWEQLTGVEVVVISNGDDRHSPPGFLQRAQNFTGAAVRHIRGGLKKVAIEIYEERLAICRKCEFFEEKREMCTEARCGCLLKRKAKWASEACPLGHWEAVPTHEDS